LPELASLENTSRLLSSTQKKLSLQRKHQHKKQRNRQAMPRRNRQTLKESFRQGKKPSENDFKDLIDSMLNTLDDGFSKTPDAGVGLAPLLESGAVISVFKEPADLKPQWEVAINAERNLEIRRCEDENRIPVLVLKPDGAVELGRKGKETVVKDLLQVAVREGNLYRGNALADGRWHDITGNLEGCRALEVVAYAEKRHSRKCAVLVATATVCCGAHPSIRKVRSHSGGCGHKIRLRWRKSKRTLTAKLQLRTTSKYGDDTQIHYHVTGLLHDQAQG
jgi:hypothetical protein